MYVKLPMHLFFLYGAWIQLLRWGKNPLLGSLEGVGPENWAQVALVAISGPKKVLIFRAHPFQWPSNWIFPHQNHYVPRHTKHNRYINSYFFKSKNNTKRKLSFIRAEKQYKSIRRL
jgi:hypothetical protein